MYYGYFQRLFARIPQKGRDMGTFPSAVVAAGAILSGAFLESAYAAGDTDELTGIVLSIVEAGTYAAPSVSGSFAEGVTLVGSPTLVDQKGGSVGLESDFIWASDYKKSFYSPSMLISSVNVSWTWSVSFKVSTDMSLDKTQVAFFSCDKNEASSTSYANDYTINYTMTLSGEEGALSTAAGSVLLAGAEYAEAARYDLATGSILEGSGGVALADWAQPLILQAGHTYTYSMTVSGTDNSGTHTPGAGFGAVRFIPVAEANRNQDIIPEPASSVLTLSALAAFLLPRRRRCMN